MLDSAQTTFRTVPRIASWQCKLLALQLLVDAGFNKATAAGNSQKVASR
jgi:hypothetical protein